MGAAGQLGTDILGRGANIATLLSSLQSPGGLQSALINRAEALQDPNVRNTLMGNRFLSRALGVGGQTLPVVPGRETFVPNLPQLGAEQQAGMLENLAKVEALRSLLPNMTPQQKETLLGFRSPRAAGIPVGSVPITEEGFVFQRAPSGEKFKVGAAPGLRPKRAVTINPVTRDLQLRLETPAEPQPTAKGRLDAALRAGDVVKELEPKYPFGLGAERDWDPSTQAELIGAMRDAGMIAPGQETAVLQALTNDDGSFNREAYDALAVAGRGQRIQSAFEGIP
jgi:hypothetical protein